MSFTVCNMQNPIGLQGQISSSNPTALGFTFVPQTAAGQSLPMVAGEVACSAGDCWVRFQKSIQLYALAGGVSGGALLPSGVNANLPQPPAIAGTQGNYTDGWIHLVAGMSIPFGSDPPADTAVRDPVSEIDVYMTAGFATEVNIIGH